ncbi:glycosyltransferase family 2 protein [Croceicoccus marinus]|jgi:hypothetical protein|uniref:Glycosyltransferase family 2 protein n=1 Tax=Croceicoccus marinus TaxID=450378 RepID=A0A7G6VZH9_9SPHN|nr:glycosyltransferase family 2 protein [Croceicoccus marinus]QNE07144.1 glycosyltransferase family 2 protein [Croceicoccus marinus]
MTDELHPAAPNLLCLTPVRNGAPHFERFFRNLAKLGARLIALDDGSTDDTRAILSREPSVIELLTNPERPDYHGWDDAQNRKRLLAAADRIRPDWILWLDIDEIIAECDITLFQAFLREEARPDKAYGLEVLRMIGDEEHFDRGRLWVYRLLAWKPGFTLPDARLHFEPVPKEIGEEDWIRTRLRILHFSSHTDEARQARFRKYLEADPDCDWQDNYDDLLDEPERVWPVRPLREGQDLVIG